MADNQVEGEDDGEEFAFEKAEDGERKIPKHADTDDDDCMKNRRRESEDRPMKEEARKPSGENVPQPRRDLTIVELKFVVVGVFQTRERIPMIPVTMMIAVSTHPKTP